MIKNFFKTAIRSIGRYKVFSFLNITGLGLGLTACLLIGLFVWDERQYDLFVPEGKSIYRVYNERTGEDIMSVAATPPMFATHLRQNYPGIDKTMRILMAQYRPLVEAGNKKIYEENGFFADSTFFDFFPLSLKFGSRRAALDDPGSVVLSQEMAEKYFGTENPVGKTISFDKQTYQVKAVLAKSKAKFHLRTNFIIPLSALQMPKERMESWQWQQFFTYVKLGQNTNAISLENKFQDYIKKEIHPVTKESGSTYIPYFQPLHQIHLYSAKFKFDNAIRGNISYIRALSIIALFILLIACFNFVNLATAKSMQRAKEVGVRKAIGANRKQLIIQFTGETIFMAFISMVLAVGCALSILPALNNFTGKQISPLTFADPLLLAVLLIGVLLTGILAGIYPAWVLSGFRPVKVLKGAGFAEGRPGKIQWLRHGLVMTQFALSSLLIISTMIVYQQVNFLNNKDLGFNKDQILFFQMRGDKIFRDYESFKNDLLQSPAISSATIGYGFPGDAVAGDEILVPRNGQRQTHPATQLMVDYDYIKTLDLHVIAGRAFSREIKTDKDEAFMINETAVKQLGFVSAEKAIGQKLLWHPWEATKPDSMKTGKVIGVVKDFNYKSLYDKMETAVLQIYPPAYWKVAVKLKTANTTAAINHVRSVWNKFSPDYPIEYKFMDDNFEQLYISESKLKSLLSAFTGVAIFVGCLGLFGLTAYAAERRKKEIGVRKVLGASVNGIIILLSKNFVILVLGSMTVAGPVAWYLMRRWLQDFAFRITISWWIFVAAAVVALAIALLTVCFQAAKAAMANPVKSLRAE